MEDRVIELQKKVTGLKDKLRFFEEIVNKAPCFLYINEIGRTREESTWRNVYLNKFALDNTGYTREEVDELGPDYFKKILHPDDFEVATLSIEHLKNISDEEVFGGPYKYMPKNKDYKWLIGMSRVFRRDTDGNPREFLNAAVIFNEEFHTHNQIIDLLKENKRLLNENTVLKLTRRERDVLKLLARGDCSKRIAQKLNVSESTIISHRKNMLKKLNMHSTATLVNFAVENGLN
jgi:DNA-binding NarL/FixJ family response regulator